MIYTRMINDTKAVIDYDSTNKDLNLEFFLAIKTMFERKDLSEEDLCVMILGIFKNLSETKRLKMVDILINNVKGGNLWQELEDLSKSEKK